MPSSSRNDPAVAQIVRHGRLRPLVGLEPQGAQVCGERGQVDVVLLGGGDHLVFRQHKAEGVEQLLKLSGRRLDAGAAPTDPVAAPVAHGLVPALPGDLDPVDAPGQRGNDAAAGGDGRAAPAVEQARQAFLQAVRVFRNAGDSAVVVNPNEQRAAVGVGEGADRPSDGPEVAGLALELDAGAFARVREPLKLGNVHGIGPPEWRVVFFDQEHGEMYRGCTAAAERSAAEQRVVVECKIMRGGLEATLREGLPQTAA